MQEDCGCASRCKGRSNLAAHMPRLAKSAYDQLSAAANDEVDGLLEARAQAVRERIQRARFIVKHATPEREHSRRAVLVHHTAWGVAFPLAACSSNGSPAEMTCAATRSPVTFRVVLHMSRKRSTPR